MKCKIEFEDNLDGTVKVVSTPDVQTLQRMYKLKHDWSPAEGMFITALNHVWKNTRKPKESNQDFIESLQ